MAFKTEAIILRERTLIGADRMYEILTPTEGKLSVVGRSVSKSSSKMAGHCAQFAHVKMMIGRGRQDHLAGVRTIKNYRSIREQWFDFVLASSLVELILTVNVPGQVAAQEFALLQKTLDMLTGEYNQQDKAFLGRIFLWKMLSLSGWKPNVNHCAQCRSELTGAIYYRSPQGFLCGDHGRNGLKIDRDLLPFLEMVIDDDNWDDLIQEAGSNGLRKQWLSVSQMYYQDILSNPLRSLIMFNYA